MTGLAGIEFYSFKSGGQTIRVERFPGRAGAGWPAVMLLHGANGMGNRNPVVTGVMRHLGASELDVHLVHYFDRTGTAYADNTTIHAHFAAWLETVQDGLRYVREVCGAAPLAMFGHSLGGYLTAATLIRNPAVECAVVLSGGLDENSARVVERTAPTLILHGEADVRVPITEARRLETALATAGAHPEFHEYPGEGHVLETASYAHAMDRATRFLHQHLG